MDIDNIQEFKQRREILSNNILPSSVVLIYAAKIQYKTTDIDYPFRQESNFYYLTGIKEKEAILLIHKNKNGNVKSILFNLPKLWEKEVWDGYRLGQEKPCTEFGLDESYTLDRLESYFYKLMSENKNLYYPIAKNMSLDIRMNRLLAGTKVEFDIIDISLILGEMRLIKSKYEINLIKKAISASVEGHKVLMQQCKPGMNEAELDNEFNYIIRKNGCSSLAYNSIIGGGENSCILHYTENNCILQDGDLLLVDAGGECNYYAADITRTFPINGTFSKEQKIIYDIVLQSQLAGIYAVKPGNTKFDVHTASLDVIVIGLQNLGLLTGNKEDIINNKKYTKFYMHRIGHWLGMDVHDVGKESIDGKFRPFEPGMVLTVEPGIYISKHHADVDHKWHSIGIRIEDDILVTDNGCEVLSAALPKNIEDIEQLMRS